jgi:hypothetical protein
LTRGGKWACSGLPSEKAGNTLLRLSNKFANGQTTAMHGVIMEVLHITNETLFELSADGKNIIPSPQNTVAQEEKILESLQKINKKHGNVLKKLGE